MGIFGALSTSVAGMRAQSFSLENISGNIANSQTTAFKRIDTSFLDLIPDTAQNAQLAGSVTAQSRSTNTVQGDVQQASVATFMAINGDGFFSVQKPSGFADNVPVFDGVDRYTRRGDFQLDKSGFLVNGAGYYLEGIPVDPTTGNLAGSTPQVLKFKNDFLPAQPTTKVDYRANLASYPLTTKHDTAVVGSELLNPADFSSGHNPLILGSAPPPYTDNAAPTGAVVADSKTATTTTASTLLSGGSSSIDALNTAFSASDTIVVDGKTISFNSGAGTTGSATAGTLSIDITTGTVGDIINGINAITGGTSTIAGGAITLHTGTAQDLVVSGSGLAKLGLSAGTTARAGGGTPGTGQVDGNDLQAFLDESISGGAVTAYDVSGSPANLQFRWAKTDTSALGGSHQDTWNLFYQVDANATGTATAWQNVNQAFTFGPNGQMNPPVVSVTLNNPTVAGVTLGTVTINFGSGGLTQFADANGNVQVNQVQQDGFPAGQLQSVSVNDRGRIVGNYSNGRNIDLAEISLSIFNGANFLKRVDGGAFEVTDQSGPALSGGSGRIVGASLEGSNTDIADEFTKLIVTQQAYSANTRVITTSNNMVQDLLNMLR